MKYLLLISLSYLLANCAGSIYQVMPTPRSFKNYELNKSQSASVGESIIESENAVVVDCYEVVFDYTVPSLGLFSSEQASITRGMRFTVFGYAGQDKNGILLKKENTDNKAVFISIYKDGKINHGYTLANGTVPVQGSWTKDQLFTLSDNPSRISSFKSEIIYSGINGKLLKAVYREYSNDLARPAFSQELQYDLNESDIISYKKIRIKVLKASNSTIEYIVINDGV